MGKKVGEDDQDTALLIEEIREFASNSRLLETERLLGISEGFMRSLLEDKSDWEFVIKLAVVVEAALGQTIASQFDSPQMQDHLARLSIDGRSGKIQFAKDLGLIGPKAQARLRAIAAIRNAFAHDVAVIHLSLEKYIASLGLAEGARLVNTLLGIDGKDITYQSKEYNGDGARYILWTSGSISLFEFARSYQNNANAQSWRNARTLMGEAFIARMTGSEAEAQKKLQEARSILEPLAQQHRPK